MKRIFKRKSTYFIMFLIFIGTIGLLYGMKKQQNSHLMQENQKMIYSIGNGKEKCLDISTETEVIVYNNGSYRGCCILTYNDIPKGEEENGLQYDIME